MLISLFQGQAPLRLFLFFVLSQLGWARVPITPLTMQSFLSTFNAYPPQSNGGCDRNSPQGVPMMPHTLSSLGGAWAIAQTGVQDLPNYPTQTYIRGLLFLFFGITFQANQQLNADPDNTNAYNTIFKTFEMVDNVFTNPGYNIYNLKPRYRCLEDYASYWTNVAGSDGLENKSAPLIGTRFDESREGGYKRPAPYNDIWPGLMRVDNRLDGSKAWYNPNPNDPPNGLCGTQNDQWSTRAFTNAEYFRNPTNNPTANALYGVTACPVHYTGNLLMNMGIPTGAGGVDEITHFTRAADATGFHELIHVVTSGVVVDQPSVRPPDMTSWLTNRNYATWISVSAIISYGYLNAALQGLARPTEARLNADNYVMLAICLYFPELDCLGLFQNHLQKKRSVPAGLSPRAVERIRSGKFDLRKDLPMDIDLEQEPASNRTAGGSNFGVEEMGESRFRDVDAPSPIIV